MPLKSQPTVVTYTVTDPPSVFERLGVDPFSTVISLIAIVTGIIFFFEPEAVANLSITKSLGLGYAYAWNTSYMVGGIAILLGRIVYKPNIEGSGFMLWVAGAIIRIIALLAVYRFFSIEFLTAGFTQFSILVASLIKVWILSKGEAPQVMKLEP